MNNIEAIGRDIYQERERLVDVHRQIASAERTEKLPDIVQETKSRDLPDRNQDQNEAHSGNSPQGRWMRHTPAAVTYSDLKRLQTTLSSASGTKTDQESIRIEVLDESEKEMVRQLQLRDQEVRLHEQTHAAALGAYAGSISYTYQTGPDGVSYAIGGTTQVRPAAGSDPTSEKQWARLVRQAALAAGEASAADVSVAADAARTEAKANRASVDLIA